MHIQQYLSPRQLPGLHPALLFNRPGYRKAELDLQVTHILVQVEGVGSPRKLHTVSAGILGDLAVALSQDLRQFFDGGPGLDARGVLLPYFSHFHDFLLNDKILCVVYEEKYDSCMS